ncbi:MAG: UDP-3-O-acylglucosamine N-acyltransferase [Chlamydiales bacterium]|nr:UDP-3-O-acylglucosamine N-acyltransferase [Chlamydiales bacterium]
MKPAYTLEELATLTGSELSGDPTHLISGVEDLEHATSTDASFLENPRYEKQMRASLAGVIFLSPSARQAENQNYLINASPSLAFQKAIELFIQSPSTGFNGIHPTAVVHPEALIGEGVKIGPHVTVDRGAKIGDRTLLEANVSVGAESTIGEDCQLYQNVVVREGCQLGRRVILQPGVVIGSCGFGYFTDKNGSHHKLKQLGTVIVEDDVEIGANTTIDRARFKETRIKEGSKLDNLVQIAHQVEVGKHNLMAAQVGVAGSTKTGSHVVMGGQVGVAGHISIADGVMFAAKSGVSKSVSKGGIYGGIPAAPIKEVTAQFIHSRNIGKFYKRVKDLEQKLDALLKVESLDN